MEEGYYRPANPRRRRKTKMEIIKEAYLPTIILGITLLLVVIFIVGALARGAKPDPAPVESTPALTDPTVDPNLAVVDRLLAEAKVLADKMDYAGAIAVLDSFAGDKTAYPALTAMRQEYEKAAANMVSWSADQVTCLSFHTLIADPTRAFADKAYGSAYNRNFVTCQEFSKILDSLYEKGYVLVSLNDYVEVKTDESGHIATEEKELKLPVGKKPLLLVQTNANYYTYMLDSNGDKEPDKGGAGFACKLVVNDGKLMNEMIDTSGSTVTGAYDLVPILENFVEQHPDFSHNGAKAVLALTGYDGAFGYRINASVAGSKGEQYRAQQVQDFAAVANVLRERGYQLACYSYDNVGYGTISAQEIQSDVKKWQDEIGANCGGTEILVYAQNSEITEYSGSKFNVLQNAGFRYYIGIGTGTTGAVVGSNYYLQKRLPVTGSQMAHSSVYGACFDATAVLDGSRGNVPN